jgi:hypothetical protein
MSAPMNPQTATTEVASRKSEPVILHGRRLLVARATWVALATLTLGLFVASVPVAYDRYGTLCEGVKCAFLRITPEDAKVLQEWGLSIDFYPRFIISYDIAYAVGYWMIGLTLFWRRSDARMVLFASIALVIFGARNGLLVMMDAYPGWALLFEVVSDVGIASFFVLFCVFPDGHFVPRWTRWAAAAWIAYHLLDYFFPDSPFAPDSWPELINLPLFLGLLGSLVVAQIYRYRRVSGVEERQQTKWVVFGLAAAIFVLIVVGLVGRIYAVPPLLYWLVSVPTISLSFLLIPLSIGVAILRHHLWDIDLIIRRSLVIGPLLTILTVVFELATQLLLPFIFQFIPALDDSSSIKTVVSVLIVVVLFKPLHARLDADVNRVVDWLVGGHRTSESLRCRIRSDARCLRFALPDLLRLRPEVSPPSYLIYRSTSVAIGGEATFSAKFTPNTKNVAGKIMCKKRGK